MVRFPSWCGHELIWNMVPLGLHKAALLAASAGGVSVSGGTETEYTDTGVTYKVHSFLSSSSLVIEGAGSGVNMDILIVAGAVSYTHLTLPTKA